jgi:peptidyl-prolyl cis-trans isomerase D
MGIMSFLRERAGVIIVGAIGFAIVAFLLGDAISLGKPFMSMNNNVVGETINMKDFNSQVEINTNNLKQQMGQSAMNPQMTAYVVDNTWNQTISKILVNKEIERLGLDISSKELNDMLSGKNPHPQVVQSFGNPQTGQVDKNQLAAFVENIKTQPANSELRVQWENFLTSLKSERLGQKYYSLINNSVYVTSLEAKEDYTNRNKLASFNYVSLDYQSVPDSQVKLTDGDYQSYYSEHKSQFKNEIETRTFEYVAFDATPSKTDSIAVKASVDKILADFRGATNDSLFVAINSDTKAPVAYVTKGRLDPALDSLVFSAGKGAIVGPVFSNGSYKMAKVIDTKISPDSVKASHILINPATEGGLDKAKIKADSIANLIRKGASFAELAAKYGTDASKDKGGDLGTFGRGAMIPVFEEAVFNGSPGDLKVVTTQYGVHVIHIDSQKGSSKVVNDKALVSSDKTQQDAYAKASAFLGQSGNADDFDAAVKKDKLNKLIAENITAMQGSIPGIESPRELIRWAYKANEGDVSNQVFDVQDKYVVAKLTDVKAKGILPLDKVKKQIEPMVRKHVKAVSLLEKMDKALAGSSNINQVAQKLGKTATPVQNIVFANPVIPGISQESKAVGAVFGLQPGKLSKAIEGESGVYVVSPNGFSNPPALTNIFKQKQQVQQTLLQRTQGEAFKALKEKANITDNRQNFF